MDRLFAALVRDGQGDPCNLIGAENISRDRGEIG
jgi:hypothetical protein